MGSLRPSETCTTFTCTTFTAHVASGPSPSCLARRLAPLSLLSSVTRTTLAPPLAPPLAPLIGRSHNSRSSRSQSSLTTSDAHVNPPSLCVGGALICVTLHSLHSLFISTSSCLCQPSIQHHLFTPLSHRCILHWLSPHSNSCPASHLDPPAPLH
jgi:hypothetical protein